MDKSTSASWPFFIALVFLLAMTALYIFHPTFQKEVLVGLEVFSNEVEGDEAVWINSFGTWGPVVILLGFVLQMFLFFIPSILLIVVCIVAFGGWTGSVIALAGVLLASTVGYLLGRFLGKRTLHKLIGDDKRKKFDFFIERYGVWTIIVSRFNPFLSIDALSFVAGMGKMSFWKFITGTVVGIAPLILLIWYFGKDQDQFMNELLWFSIFSLLCLGAFIYLDQRVRKGKKEGGVK